MSELEQVKVKVKVKDTQPPKKSTKENKIESYFNIKWLTGC